MRVLLVDTAGSEGGVLLARNDSDACEATATEILGAMRLEPREFSTQLISSITKLLQATSLELSMLDALGVVSGPGSFTGLRIGLSAVKAIAEVTGKPVIAISRLAIMASAAACREASVGETVHAILDAGRGEFYHGIYRDAGRTRLAESLQTLETLTAAMKSTPGRMIASEPNVLAALSTLGEGLPQCIPPVTVREGLPLILADWQARRFCDVAQLDGNYLRRIEPVVAARVSATATGRV